MFSESVRTIRCDGFTLEPQTAAHAEQMFVVLNDPAIYEYEDKPPPSLELEWLRERFARLESRRSGDGRQQWLNWVIRLPTDVQPDELSMHREIRCLTPPPPDASLSPP